MSTVNANVTRGYTFVFDGNGQFLITLERLNQVALPVVTVDLSGKVDTADLVDAAVTAVKLANAVADRLRAAVATVAAESSNNVDVTIQVQDVQGNNLSEVTGIRLWLSGSANGAPAALPSGGAPTIISSQGTIIEAMTDTAPGTYLTNSSGVLALRFTEAGALTKYLVGLLQDDLVSGSAALTWTA